MAKRKQKIKAIPRDAAFTPFYRCNYFEDALGNRYDIPSDQLWLRNSIYMVDVRQLEDIAPFGGMTWLSIKRIDRRPIHDWRDLQRIKNAIVGPEREAVEIYPAESRLTDTANQYHLWCFPEGYRLPFGYADRVVTEGATDPERTGINAVQRPFRPDERPVDLMTPDEYAEKIQADNGFGARMVHKHRRGIEWEAVKR